MRNIAILLASGTGSRVGDSTPKQFLELGGKYLFEYPLKTFNNHINIDEIILVCHPEYIEFAKSVIKQNGYTKVSRVIPGGNTRQESVSNGVFSIVCEEGKVLIHDTARPFVTNDVITRVLDELNIYNAVSTVVPADDTIFVLNNENCVASVPLRSSLVRVQTPQGFALDTIRKAHYLAQKQNLNIATDDCSLVLKFNIAPIKTIIGDDICFKVTTAKDLLLAKSVIENFPVFNSDKTDRF